MQIRFSDLHSITLKFVVLLVPAVTLATIVFCAIVGYLAFREQSNLLEQKLELLIKTHGGAIAEPLWNINLEGAQSSVATVVLHPEIVCAIVTQTQWSSPISFPEHCSESSDPSARASAALTTRGRIVGNLDLYYTKDPIFAAIKRDMFESALLFALLLLVAATVAYAALRIIILTPLDLLLSSIRSSESGQSSESIHWSSCDELGRVVAAYNDMSDQVVRNTSELVAAREDAEKAGASKTRFLANMSHELRTPLNAVIGITEMMRDYAVKKNENIEPYERVTRAGRHLLGLIDNILDFSKIDADRIELVVEEVPTQSFLYDISSTASELVRRNGNEFNLECGLLPSVLNVDILRLTQILINLIGNASKFTKNGSVLLTVSRISGFADVANAPVVEEDTELEFRITDTGIGMTSEQLDRLFVDFSEIDQVVTRKYGGTGLGLAISQRLCELMGSRIHVSSVPAEGSTFYFKLRV